MRKLLAAIALALLPLGLAGCATLAKASGQEEVATLDERALLTVEVSYGVALTSIAYADQAGLITPPQAAKILIAVEDAEASIDKARALYDANRLVEANGATTSATLQVAALLQLLIDAGLIE